MTDAPQTAVAEPTPANHGRVSAMSANGRGGISARGEQQAAEAIAAALADLGLTPRQVELRPLPFEGTWGLAT